MGSTCCKPQKKKNAGKGPKAGGDHSFSGTDSGADKSPMKRDEEPGKVAQGSEGSRVDCPSTPQSSKEKSSSSERLKTVSLANSSSKEPPAKTSTKEQPKPTSKEESKDASSGLKCLDPLDTVSDELSGGQPKKVDPWARALCKLAADLYGKIGSDENVLFSPYSVAMGLVLVELGSFGDTREELLRLLSQSVVDTTQCIQLYAALQTKILEITKLGPLYIVNNIFRDVGVRIKEAYVIEVAKMQASVIDSSIAEKTEEARKQINQWVSNNTAELVPELIKPGGLDPSYVTVLANATCMKLSCPAKQMKQGAFHGTKQEQKVEFICGENPPYMGRRDYHAVELQIKGETGISMYIILPRRRNGISDLEKHVTANFLMEVITNTRHLDNVQVRMEIPKFTARHNTSLLSPLMYLGFKTAGGLGRMSDDPRMKVSEIRHEGVIIFDEIQSTEGSSAPKADSYVSFVADHPFLYAVVHKPTLTALFMGKMSRVEV